MFSGRLTTLPSVSSTGSPSRTGQRGEEDAYFYLRKLGYVMVARNFRSPNRRGRD
jgi:hypothetical protein